MDLVKYSISEFKNKQNVKCLLEKLGLPPELWNNSGQNFWAQSKLDLLNILEIAKKTYKKLAIQLHPRKLDDPDEESKKLNSLWVAIESRFDYKLNKEKIVPELFGTVECECGCGRNFKSQKNGKKYFNKKCKNRLHHKKRNFERRSKRRGYAVYSNENLPLISCKCGCGRNFRQTGNGNKRLFFSKKCNGNFYRSSGRYIVPREKARVYELKYRIKRKLKQENEQKIRHENLQKILSGAI